MYTPCGIHDIFSFTSWTGEIDVGFGGAAGCLLLVDWHSGWISGSGFCGWVLVVDVLVGLGNSLGIAAGASGVC